jgi:hypothetical protein
MRMLEQVAGLIERDLRLSLKSGDPATTYRIGVRTWQIAAAVRECKSAVAFDRHTVLPDLLRNRLAPMLVAATQGRWGDMPRIDGLPQLTKESVVGTVARRLVRASTGLLALSLIVLSVYLQTDEGQAVLEARNIGGGTAGNAGTVISSIAAAILLFRAQASSESAPGRIAGADLRHERPERIDA